MNDETIGEVNERGARLALLCNHCGRLRYIRNDFPETSTIKAVASTLKCHRCGTTDVNLKALVRDPQSGFWPAEHG